MPRLYLGPLGNQVRVGVVFLNRGHPQPAGMHIDHILRIEQPLDKQPRLIRMFRCGGNNDGFAELDGFA
ncbi:hypothetical protein D3C87_2105030 [compost metagenome]